MKKLGLGSCLLLAILFLSGCQQILGIDDVEREGTSGDTGGMGDSSGVTDPGVEPDTGDGTGEEMCDDDCTPIIMDEPVAIDDCPKPDEFPEGADLKYHKVISSTPDICYVFVTSPQENGKEAQKICRDLRGHLAAISDAGELSFWNDSENPTGVDEGTYLLGLVRNFRGTFESEDTYFTTGKAINYGEFSGDGPFGVGEPASTGNCVGHDMAEHTWRTLDCGETHSYICEFVITE